MPSTNVKLGIGLSSLGVIGGLGYGIHALTDATDSLENFLIKHDLIPIEKDDSEDEWIKIFESYKLEKTSETSIQDKEVTKPDEIKKWCVDNLKNNIRSTADSLFKKASKWCVEIITIENTLGGNDKFETEATKLANKYGELEKEIKDLINAGEAESSDNNTLGERMKKWCDSNRKRRSSEDEEELYFSNIRKICLKSQNGDD